MLRLSVIFSILLIGACTQHNAGNSVDESAVTKEGGSDVAVDASEPILMTVDVGPERVDCMGVVPMRCLVVDGELFYDEIQGFDYQKGNSYTLKIERSDAFSDGLIPADASRYMYRLIDIIKKTPQD